jgi:ABC-type transporter Mla MlaB component
LATPDEASHDRIAAVCERARAVLENSDAGLVDCDVHALVDPDATTVDALARLQLTARRLGKRIRFRHACGEMQELVALMGLRDVLPGAGSRIESWREAEEREQAGGVEEEADP